MGKQIDMTGKKCNKCFKGVYKEMSIYDDWDGLLTCNNCGKKIGRWQDKLTRKGGEVE